MDHTGIDPGRKQDLTEGSPLIVNCDFYCDSHFFFYLITVFMHMAMEENHIPWTFFSQLIPLGRQLKNGLIMAHFLWSIRYMSPPLKIYRANALDPASLFPCLVLVSLSLNSKYSFPSELTLSLTYPHCDCLDSSKPLRLNPMVRKKYRESCRVLSVLTPNSPDVIVSAFMGLLPDPMFFSLFFLAARTDHVESNR